MTAQLYKKTGTCSRPSGALTDYPMYLVVGESANAPRQVTQCAYPTAHSDTYVKATSKRSTTHWPYYATDPTRSLTGTTQANWWSSAEGAVTNQRFHIDLGSARVIRGIYYENMHWGGAATDEGAKNFIMQGSAESTAFAELTYATDTNWTQIGGSMQFEQHVASDVADPKYIAITNSTAYRYIALKIADNWGRDLCMGLRRIVLLTDEGFVHCDAHCKPDFGDIRFHDSTDAALNYMIDWPTLTGTTPNQSVGVWVAPSPGTTDTDVVLKYGDAALTDASDGTAVFLKYKGFESGNDGDSIADADEDWTVVSGTCEIDTAQKYSGTRSLRLVGAATRPDANMALTAATGYAIRVCGRKTNAADYFYPCLHGNGSKRIHFQCLADETIRYYNSAGSHINTGNKCSVDTWELFEVCNINWTSGTYDLWFNGVCIVTGAEMANAVDDANVIRVHCPSSYDSWIDDLIVRKYASPEPTWGTWGEETEISTDTDFIVTTSLDGLLQDTVSTTTSLDAYLPDTATSTVSLDGTLQESSSATASIDGILQKSLSASTSLDSLLEDAVSAAPENWELTVETTDVDQTFTVNISAGTSIDITIDWDDGNAPVNYNTTGVKTCTYATAGTYYPKVSGSFTNGIIKLGSRLKATGVIGGVTGFLSCDLMFDSCTGLTTVPADLFRYVTGLGANAFSSTFKGCSGLVSVPEDLFKYSTGAANNAFESTFNGCSALTAVPEGLFRYNTAVGIEGFKDTFRDCSSLTTVPEDLFRYNTAVTSSAFRSTFYGCTGLTSIPAGLFQYNIHVSTHGFYQVFKGCTSLTTLPALLFRNNLWVTTSGFAGAFQDCTSLTTIPELFFRYNERVSTSGFSQTFSGCTSLASLPVDLFRYNKLVSTSGFHRTFYGCNKLTLNSRIFYAGDGLITRFADPVPTQNFTECFKLTGPFTGVQGTAPAMWDYTFNGTPTSTDCFEGHSAESVTNYYDIPEVWGGPEAVCGTGLDGQLQSSSSASISIDGMLSSSNQATTGLDAVLSDSATVVILSFDSLLQDTNTATASLDAQVTSTLDETTGLDGILQAVITTAASIDAVLWGNPSLTVSLDAVVIAAIMSETVSLDALLEGTETSTASLDAILKMYYIESVETEIDLESETIAGIIYQQSIAESFYLWTTSQPSWSISVTSTTDLASTLTFDLGIDVYSYVTFTETLSSKWTGQLSILEAIALTSTAEDVRYLLEAITSTYDLSGAQVVTFELALTEWLDIKSAASNSSKMFFELLSTAGLSCSTVGIWLEEITSALNISSLTQYDIVEALESATDLSDTTLIYLAAALSDSIDLSSESRVALALSVLSEIGFTSLASFIGAPQESILSELEIADTLEDNGIFNHSLASSVFLTEEAQAALSLLVTSVLALTSTAALKKWLTEQVTSAAILASNTSALQSMYPSLESSLTITETLLGNGAYYETVQSALQLSVSIELDGDVYECWVLNSPKFLPSIYTDYDFNSYCTYENRAFAANATGVYELAGDADDVQASVVLSETDFEVSGHKRFRKAYLGISGTSPVLIMETDGQRKVYSIASDGKVNASRELLGKYWKLSVVDFDTIEYISLIPVVLSRGK